MIKQAINITKKNKKDKSSLFYIWYRKIKKKLSSLKEKKNYEPVL